MNKNITRTYDGNKHYNGYIAAPETDTLTKYPGLIIISEIWGLNDHIKDICNRFAQQGFVVFSPDLLGDSGILEKMNPSLYADMKIPEKKLAAQAKMREIMQPLHTKEFTEQSIARIKDGVDMLLGMDNVSGTIGVLGFCFAGTYSFHTAINEPRVKAGVVFYGQSPNPIEIVGNIHCPILAFYGELDTGLMPQLPVLVDAMKKYDKIFEYYQYPNTGHAFFNDTNKPAYNEEAAGDAWNKSLRFLKNYLKD